MHSHQPCTPPAMHTIIHAYLQYTLPATHTPCGQNDICFWKHYLPATSFAGGNDTKMLIYNIKLTAVSCQLISNSRMIFWYQDLVHSIPFNSIADTLAASFSELADNLFEFSRNTQSWQHWHLCTISIGNKLEMVKSQLSFNANLHLPWYFELKLKWLILLSNMSSSNTKNANIANV